jgi:hypothetical protein
MEPIQKKRKIQTVKIDMGLYDNLSNRSFELDALKSKYESDMSSLKKEKEISEKLLKDKISILEEGKYKLDIDLINKMNILKEERDNLQTKFSKLEEENRETKKDLEQIKDVLINRRKRKELNNPTQGQWFFEGKLII